MVREFPLVSSYRNLVWNLKHYSPSSRRPAFKASRHPFCTNSQLQNASCTYWLKETSKDIGSKLVSHLSEAGKTYKGHGGKPLSQQIIKLHPAALYTPYAGLNVKYDDVSKEHSAEMEVVKLFKAGEFSTMYEKLRQYKEEGVTVSTEAINDIISGLQDEIPLDNSPEFLHQSDIETPMFEGKTDLRCAELYAGIYPHISSLYNICKLYENGSYGNTKFLENYIWLCYHMDDLTTLQQLLYSYLKSTEYSSRTLSYAINAFVLNYDVEFAKNLFQSVVGMNKPLHSTLLSSTLISFAKVGAIFDNSKFIFNCWALAENCETPEPKLVALLLKQHYSSGLDHEIHEMEQSASELGYSDHFLVALVKKHSGIVHRDLNHKKAISEEDITEVLKIRNSLFESRKDLQVFYNTNLLFFAKYSNMTMIQFILLEMMSDGVPITEFAYNVIIQHYISERKFLPLLEFIEKSLCEGDFKITYLKNIFDAFVRTYPYESEEFAHKFDNWVRSSSIILDGEKERLLAQCKLVKLESSMTPFANQNSGLHNTRKYDSPEWKKILYLPNASSNNKVKTKEQVLFRMNKGLRDVMRKGIKPDYHVLESSMRKLNYLYRVNILKVVDELRMQRYNTRLEIFHTILSNPKKSELVLFVESIENKLNTSDKLLLARRLMNSCAYDTASRLLDTLNPEEVNASRQMTKLNLSLRNDIAKNDFSSFARSIETFPIDEVNLSPYIYRQCRNIEKNLFKKIRAVEKNADSPLVDKVQEMKEVLQKLKGMIGDIDARISQDKHDVRGKVGEMFHMLDSWIKASRNTDERKI